MSNRESRYSYRSKSIRDKNRTKKDTLIIAHVMRTERGKIRLRRIGVVIGGGAESLLTGDLSENDPRLVFTDDFAVRKEAHNLVKKSGRFSKYYDCIVKVTYEDQ